MSNSPRSGEGVNTGKASPLEFHSHYSPTQWRVGERVCTKLSTSGPVVKLSPSILHLKVGSVGPHRSTRTTTVQREGVPGLPGTPVERKRKALLGKLLGPKGK